VPDEVEALVALGERSRAQEALDPFEHRAQRLRHRWGLGTAASCRGVLAGASGDLAAARDAFERAITVQRGLPEPYELGRTLLAYGVSLRRAKARRAARGALEEAAAIFERLGAALWLQRVNAELARTGARPTPADELTPTERRVAELVAEGKPNKVVAAELFVSVKAVERNLSNVYRKLGITSRTQLARRLSDSGHRQTLGTT
jgi:DNA-binding CsgD family transcriptional regulator